MLTLVCLAIFDQFGSEPLSCLLSAFRRGVAGVYASVGCSRSVNKYRRRQLGGMPVQVLNTCTGSFGAGTRFFHVYRQPWESGGYLADNYRQ